MSAFVRKRTIFDGDGKGKKTGRKALIPCTFVANEDYDAMAFDKDDPIFSLSKPVPVEDRVLSPNCSYCGDKFGHRADKHFCEFCGLQICKSCKRKRRFPMSATAYGAQRSFGDACRMCVKKLFIREMVIESWKDYDALQPTIRAKQK